jgi:hypothetical protein
MTKDLNLDLPTGIFREVIPPDRAMRQSSQQSAAIQAMQATKPVRNYKAMRFHLDISSADRRDLP